VWVADSVDLTKPDKLVELLTLFGEIHVLEAEGSKGFVGPEWTQVDIEFGHRENLEPHYRYTGARVIKDTDGVLARMAADCLPEQFVETPASAASVMYGAIEDMLYQARNNARGALWEARGSITYQASQVFQLLGRLRGRRTYGNRYAEDLLTPEEQALYWAAWPREPTQAENRRAARAHWEWTKYVWREAERAIGAPLEVAVDEAGMLAAIDRMYE
ncbi:MAG TPA: hypothetical protein VFU22_25820, partial [Roseiflexaceae bacterium]|nr:hypothetical protein [Roseiflexaceae bacterium]